MISKYALVLASHFANIEIYEKDKIGIYKYGFELLISTALNMLGIFIIALSTGTLLGAVFFCLAFIPLRLSAGGYHAKHHWSCILGFNAIFTGFVLLNKYVIAEYAFPYALAAIAVSSLLIWTLAPVEALNKPLKATQRVQQRERSIIIACVNLALVLLFNAVSWLARYEYFLAFYSSGALAAGGTLVVAVANNRKKQANEIPSE